MIKLDGRIIKEGDRIWDNTKGFVIITSLFDPLISPYPIHAKREDDGTGTSYTVDGKVIAHNAFRSLFWDEIKFDIPKPPPELVEKWQWLWFKNDNPTKMILSSYYYSTKEDALEAVTSPTSRDGFTIYEKIKASKRMLLPKDNE